MNDDTLLAKVSDAKKSTETLPDNFSLPNELTVTITLAEYRQLIRNNVILEKTNCDLQREINVIRIDEAARNFRKEAN